MWCSRVNIVSVGNGNLSTLQSVMFFVVVPLAVVAMLVLATLAPGWTRAGRYRPGEPWSYEPVLINGSVVGDVTQALRAVAPTELAESASQTATTEQASPSEPTPEVEGGVSVRW